MYRSKKMGDLTILMEGNDTVEEVVQKLKETQRKADESCWQYVKNMKKIAEGHYPTSISEARVIEFIIEGLNVSSKLRAPLYKCRTLDSLTEKAHGVDRKLPDGQADRIVDPEQIGEEPQCSTSGLTMHSGEGCDMSKNCLNCCLSSSASGGGGEENPIRFDTSALPMKKIRINEITVESVVDSGSQVSIVREKIFRLIKEVSVQKYLHTLRGLGMVKTKAQGSFMADVIVDEVEREHKFLIVPDNAINHDALLGFDFIQNFLCTIDKQVVTFQVARDHPDASVNENFNVGKRKSKGNDAAANKRSGELRRMTTAWKTRAMYMQNALKGSEAMKKQGRFRGNYPLKKFSGPKQQPKPQN